MQLKGCVNDAMRMQMVLVDRFGFKAENIRELHDETRSCDPPMANGSTRLKAPALTAR
jgi:hypothetical protein